MQKLKVGNSAVDVNEQGFLENLEDWSEEYTKIMAQMDHIDLYNDHWEIIFYFREYFRENQIAPTMHQMIVGLMSKNKKFLEKKKYEQHVYSLFPSDPIREICKLAGLPMPPPDT
jgi:tRNA 2-thiouridine synthesizing protein E